MKKMNKTESLDVSGLALDTACKGGGTSDLKQRNIWTKHRNSVRDVESICGGRGDDLCPYFIVTEPLNKKMQGAPQISVIFLGSPHLEWRDRDDVFPVSKYMHNIL